VRLLDAKRSLGRSVRLEVSSVQSQHLGDLAADVDHDVTSQLERRRRAVAERWQLGTRSS
jgi:hypothetical protein